jgi:hypothetical protein
MCTCHCIESAERAFLNKRIIHNLLMRGGCLPPNLSTKSLATKSNVQRVHILRGLRKLFWVGWGNCSGRLRKLWKKERRKIHPLNCTSPAKERASHTGEDIRDPWSFEDSITAAAYALRLAQSTVPEVLRCLFYDLHPASALRPPVKG